MADRIDLTQGWTLHLADPEDRAVPESVRAGLPTAATVPGCVHTDLLSAELIPDPYLDVNELDLDWIGRASWIYRTSIEGARPGPATLVFEGLDTVATVTLNGAVVASTENMHVRHEVPVVLGDGANVLAVRFDSAETFAEHQRDLVGALPNQYPAPFNHIRKMACNFGWDWGPSLVTAGIWRPVTLVRGPRIREVRPHTSANTAAETTGWTVRFQVHLADLAEPCVLRASVAGAEVETLVEAGTETAELEVRVEDVMLWWPRGMGEQHRYEAGVELLPTAAATSHSTPTGPDAALDSWRELLGFRTVRLETEPDDDGTGFVLVVNDLPVPVRGANWIPDDCFPSRVTRDRVRTRIRQAVDANVNLLRVWGGGVYESRDFYQLCDEQGVLVWQDFLFACAAYPEDDRLARQVEAEARDNVARLLPHPSLVLWNGNNENIWGYEDWDWKAAIGDRAWGLGYYLDLLPRVVAELDPSRPYWPGSPYSGSPDIHPNSDDHGTRHVWDVWNEVDYTAYRDHRPRFVAEFGWQAPPTWSTLTRAVSERPLTPDSPALLHHQKAEDGQGKLSRGLAPHFSEPVGLDDWLWATQLNQARAIRLGIEHFRSLRPRCTGTILWQLNDCWPVTSWAAVDGDGHLKPVWYALRDAYRPRSLTIQPGRGPGRDGLAIVAFNDTPETWREVLTVRRLAFDGAPIATAEFDLVVPPWKAGTVELPPKLATPGRPTAELLVAEPLATDNGPSDQRALWFYAPDRQLAYPPVDIDVSVERTGDEAVVSVLAHSLVRDLCLFPDRISPDAEADDALVTLLPGERAQLRISGLPSGVESGLGGFPVLRTAADLVRTAEGDGQSSGRATIPAQTATAPLGDR